MILFPDVSHHQAGLDLTGAAAVIIKASQGATFRDPAYAGFRAQAAALGIPVAAYHWVDESDVDAQARNAAAAAGSTTLMWDAEAPGATVARLLELTARARRYGARPRLLYLPHWWWEHHLGSPDLRPLAAAGLALISSDYTPSADAGWRPYGGVAPLIWQYTNAHAFAGRPVDFNAFRGTMDELAALFAPEPEEDAMPDTIALDCLNILTALANGLDEATVHDHDGRLDLRPLYRRIAAEVLDQTPGGGAGVDVAAIAAAVNDDAAQRRQAWR